MDFRELFLIIVDNFPNHFFLTRDISNITGIRIEESFQRLRYLRRIGLINKRKDPESTHGKRFLWYVTSWGWSYYDYLGENDLLPGNSETVIKEVPHDEEEPNVDDEWRKEEGGLIEDLETGDENDRKIAERLKLLRTIEEEI
jgi:transcription initiation factor IIE alpha subunit